MVMNEHVMDGSLRTLFCKDIQEQVLPDGGIIAVKTIQIQKFEYNRKRDLLLSAYRMPQRSILTRATTATESLNSARCFKRNLKGVKVGKVGRVGKVGKVGKEGRLRE
jgi:hypothetical protein